MPFNQHTGNTLVFFVPSQIHEGVLDCIDNDNYPVKNIDFSSVPSQIQTDLKSQGQTANPLFSLSPNSKVILLGNVAGGSAAAVALLARQHPDKFQPGMEAIYLVSGGGLGISKISYVADGYTQSLIRLQTTEAAAMPHPRKIEGTEEFSMGRVGGNLGALLEDFTEELPSRYNSIQKIALQQTLNGKIATDYSTALSFLPDLSLQEFQTAASFSTREYLDSLACNIRGSIGDGCNLAVLGGKIAGGIRDFVNANPSLFYSELQNYNSLVLQNKLPPRIGVKSVFDKVFLVRLYGQLPDYARMLLRNQKFDVVSDLNIANNTEGTPYIAQGWFQNRSDRFAIPAEVFLRGSFH